MQDPEFEPPVNPLPPVVVILFLAIAGVEAVLSLGEAGFVGGREAIGWRLAWIRDWAFSSNVLEWMWANGQYPIEHVVRLFSYPFIHQAFTATIFAAVLLLALGKLVGETLGQVAVVALFFLSGIGGAVLYTALLGGDGWLIGAYPNVYGLIGGYTFVLWQQLGAKGEGQLRAFTLIAFLMGLQLVWSLLFTTGNQWVAELGGFACGFGLSFLFVPGGVHRMVAKLRRR